MKRRASLTKAELRYLRAAWANPDVPIKAMEEHLGCRSISLRRWAKDLQLGEKAGFGCRWPVEREQELLRLRGENIHPDQIAKRMGMSKAQVKSKLNRLDAAAKAPLPKAPTLLSDEKLARLRRVAAWDAAAAKALAVYEMQVAA